MEYSLLTLKYHYKGNNEAISYLRLLCHIAKNIYNRILYVVLDYYEKNKAIPDNKILYRLIGYNENTFLVDRYIMYSITNDIKDAVGKYYKYHNEDGSVKNEYINKIKDKDFAKKPHYLNKDGYYQLRTTNILINKKRSLFKIPHGIRMDNNYIFNNKIGDCLLKKFILESKLSHKVDIKFKIPRHLYNKDIREIRIVPSYNGSDFYIHLIYKEDNKPLERDNGKIIGIDLGIDNLIAAATTDLDSFIIDGRELKSIIQLHNKKLKKALTLLPYSKKGDIYKIGHSRYIDSLTTKVNAKINKYLNRVVDILFSYVIKNDIKTIVIGWNKGLKDGGVKGGEAGIKGFSRRKLNQMFSFVPLSHLKDKIELKGRLLGLRVVVINEAYTSKKSFYDNDSFYDEECSGVRIKRGLYKTKDGRLVNADINAALNIIKKYLCKGDAFYMKASHNGLTVPYRVHIRLQ